MFRSSRSSRSLGVCLFLASGCFAQVRASAPPTAPSVSPRDARSSDLRAVLARLRSSAVAAVELGVALARSGGARSLDGNPSRDETVLAAEVVTEVDASAAVTVTTSCGNARLLGLAWSSGSWRPVGSVALVPLARPGRCQETDARVRATALVSVEARELLAETRTVSDDGADTSGPSLQLFHLAPDGSLRAWSEALAFGGVDDATGSELRGEWFVEESFAPPRDLLVFVRPGHRGLAGTALTTLELRTYRVVGATLHLVEHRVEAVRASPPPR